MTEPGTDPAQGGTSSGGSSSGGADAGTPVTVPPRFLGVLQPDGQGCLPEVLPHDTNGDSTCSVLVLLSNPGQAAGCANVMGLAPAPAEVALRLSELEPSVVPGHPLCTLQQIAKTRWVDGTCTTFPSPGWCYVDGPAAGASCPQAIRFSNGAPPIGAMTWLACP